MDSMLVGTQQQMFCLISMSAVGGSSMTFYYTPPPPPSTLKTFICWPCRDILFTERLINLIALVVVVALQHIADDEFLQVYKIRC